MLQNTNTIKKTLALFAVFTNLSVACSADDKSHATVQHFQGNTNSDYLKKNFPFAVKILNSTGAPYCSGTLVTSEIVVTASHCLGNGKPSSPFPLGLKIETTLGEIIEVSHGEGMNHELINFHIEGVDIGYIKLKKPSTMTKIFPKIALTQDITAAKSVAGSLDLVSVGVGETKNPGQPRIGSFNYLEVELMREFGPLKNRVTFDSVKGSLESSDAVFTEFLAGSFGNTACSGDSGGGSFAKVKRSGTPEYILVGIVSRGIGYRDLASEGVNCGERVAEIYSFAHAGKDWIETRTGLKL